MSLPPSRWLNINKAEYICGSNRKFSPKSNAHIFLQPEGQFIYLVCLVVGLNIMNLNGTCKINE